MKTAFWGILNAQIFLRRQTMVGDILTRLHWNSIYGGKRWYYKVLGNSPANQGFITILVGEFLIN